MNRLQGTALLVAMLGSMVVTLPALGGSALDLPLRMPLAAVRSAASVGQGARLICSNDDSQVTVNGVAFPASALGSGVLDVVACRWFGTGSAPSETKAGLFGLQLEQVLSFVAADPGGQPLLYDVLALGDPQAFDAARAAMEAAFGPGQATSSRAAVGPHLEWHSDGFAASLTRQASDTGRLTIEYTDKPLESRALGLN